jgi:hypothetical protein
MKTLRRFALTLTVTVAFTALGACRQASAAEPELEPAVDTSAAAPASASPAPAAAPPPAAPATKPAVAPQKAPAPSGAAPAGQPATGTTRGTGRAQDRLELDATQITGNSELPRVLYVVPWKRSDLGDLTGRPVNSLLDEVLAPVDRDVFRRQNRYYDALHPDTAPGGSPGVATEGEK